MLGNLFLAIVIAMMLVQAIGLAMLHRRPSDLVFAAFWALLLLSQFTRPLWGFPAILLCISTGVLLRRREASSHPEASGKGIGGEPELPKPGPTHGSAGLWDREVDGLV